MKLHRHRSGSHFGFNMVNLLDACVTPLWACLPSIRSATEKPHVAFQSTAPRDNRTFGSPQFFYTDMFSENNTCRPPIILSASYRVCLMLLDNPGKSGGIWNLIEPTVRYIPTISNACFCTKLLK